jgi:aldehyde dehydrogenase (NAD+)
MQDIDDHAVEIANDSSYGLSAGVFCADDERALRVARCIRAGSVGVKSSRLNVAFPNGGFNRVRIRQAIRARGCL